VPITDSRKARWLTVACLAWTLAAATYATLRTNFERAPVVHVRWAQFVDDSTRAQLQKRFGLAGEQYDSGTTWVYLLTSPTTKNIQALVESPAVEDTHHMDRVKFVVSPAAPRRGPYIATGRSWIPLALQGLIAFLAAAGVMALIVANALTIRRAVPRMRATLVAAWPLYGLCGALVVLWVFYFAQLLDGAKESAPFRVGDWLVSYQVGFVRRGLPGSPILALTTLFDASPERIVLWLQTVLYTVLVGLLFVLLRRKRLNIWFLAFLFSPAGLLFPLYDPAVIGRKDVLFMVVLALYAWWMPAPERRWARLTTFALGAAITLAHELFFFFTPYFFVMRLLREKRTTTARRFALELWLFGGSFVALLVVSIMGANLHGEAQCAELLRRGFNEQLCDGILRYPATTIRESISELARTIGPQSYLVAYPIAAVLAALPLIPLLATGRVQLTRSFVVGSLMAFSFTLPMFVIVVDWGRLLSIHVVALAVMMGAFLLEDRPGTGPIRSTRGGSWLWAAILLGVFLYLTTWSIRHCCEDPLRAGIFEPD
jgi:hypothetical protein